MIGELEVTFARTGGGAQTPGKTSGSIFGRGVIAGTEASVTAEFGEEFVTEGRMANGDLSSLARELLPGDFQIPEEILDIPFTVGSLRIERPASSTSRVTAPVRGVFPGGGENHNESPNPRPFPLDTPRWSILTKEHVPWRVKSLVRLVYSTTSFFNEAIQGGDMDNPAESYWRIRIEECAQALADNNFEAVVADSAAHAKEIALERMIPALDPGSVSYGDSMTFFSSGLLEALREMDGLRVIETFDDTAPRAEILERRRQALLVDLFFTGANAVTEAGELVSLDMIGNRVGGVTFGPKDVILFVGRNKIVPDIEAAMHRIKNYAAPANAIRHNMKTPCVKTGHCMDCKSPGRICNVWTITQKSFPKGRIKVILIDDDLGL